MATVTRSRAQYKSRCNGQRRFRFLLLRLTGGTERRFIFFSPNHRAFSLHFPAFGENQGKLVGNFICRAEFKLCPGVRYIGYLASLYGRLVRPDNQSLTVKISARCISLIRAHLIQPYPAGIQAHSSSRSADAKLNARTRSLSSFGPMSRSIWYAMSPRIGAL